MKQTFLTSILFLAAMAWMTPQYLPKPPIPGPPNPRCKPPIPGDPNPCR